MLRVQQQQQQQQQQQPRQPVAVISPQSPDPAFAAATLAAAAPPPLPGPPSPCGCPAVLRPVCAVPSTGGSPATYSSRCKAACAKATVQAEGPCPDPPPLLPPPAPVVDAFYGGPLDEPSDGACLFSGADAGLGGARYGSSAVKFPPTLPD